MSKLSGLLGSGIFDPDYRHPEIRAAYRDKENQRIKDKAAQIRGNSGGKNDEMMEMMFKMFKLLISLLMKNGNSSMGNALQQNAIASKND